MEVAAIGMFTAGRDAELCAGCADVRQRDPGGTVGGIGKVESIAMDGISRSRRQTGRSML